mmetsp:Transcript_117941/g.165806  ORF Transcript_117941/g.165806 Transcript_117941/m.165806 type:complete len:234 (-) Transcript_117941:156-857(-)
MSYPAATYPRESVAPKYTEPTKGEMAAESHSHHFPVIEATHTDTTPLLTAPDPVPRAAALGLCRSCSIQMLPSARFCHSCGAPSEALPPQDRYGWSVYDPGQHNEPTNHVGIACVLGSSTNSPCVVPRRITTTSLLGGSRFDLTRSKFIYTNTKIIATQILGRFRLVVPRGVNVVVNGLAILGKFKNDPNASTVVDPNRPTITIVGASILGRAQVIVDSNCPEIRCVDRPPQY